MSRTKLFILAFATVAIPMLTVPSDATAGPLLDWIRGRRNPTCATPVAACNLQPGQCMTTCQQTCSRVVVNYVPYTAYRTSWKQVPVTSYKPVTNTDPCTGCTVTCMRPCTTYTYQMQRIPYTTYRPCYRTETYKVPVTTITNDCCSSPGGACATCPTPSAVGGCNTCAGGGSMAPTVPNMAPTPAIGAPTSTVTGTYYEYPNSSSNPSGTITTEGGFNPTVQPADIAPSLNNVSPQSYNRPVLDQIRNGMQNTNPGSPIAYPQTAPPTPTFHEKTAQSPVLTEFKYSPIRLASFNATDERPATPRETVVIKGTFRPIQSKSAVKKDGLNGWVEVD